MASIEDFDFDGPASIVEDKYTRSIDYAQDALESMREFQAKMTENFYQPPTIDIRWRTTAAPDLPAIPEVPELPDVTFEEPGDMPAALSASMGNVTIDGFADEPPDLNFVQAPDIVVGAVPMMPQLNEVAIPDAPDVVMPAIPQFLSLSTHSFGGVNLHEDWLDKLDDIPDLAIAQPAPFSYTPGARYASQLLDSLKAQVHARIHGGTGLPTTVEQQLWDRARDRETAVALAREQEVMRAAQSLGFPLPSGVLAAQLSDARREYHDKLSSLSRDIAIKQAELEQANIKDAIQTALQLESTLLDDAYKIEMLGFEAAKVAADNAVTAYNAALEHYKALLARYQAFAGAYDTLVKAELSKVEAFRAMLSAEQAKADINKSLVDRYRAEVEASMAGVEVYKTRVGAAQTLVELERSRIQAAGEQIRAFVAGVGAETSKIELYKTQVEAESAKQEAYRLKVQAYSAKVGAQAEKARVEVAKYQAQVTAKGLEWDGWKARLQAATAKTEAAARQAGAIVDGYRAGAAASEAQAQAAARRWEADIKQYEAGQNILLQTQKSNNEALMHNYSMRFEANKVAMTTYAQQVASAWASVSAQAQISGSADMRIVQSI